jgi:hypothetical protein
MKRIFFSIHYWSNPNLIGQSVYNWDNQIEWIILGEGDNRKYYHHWFNKFYIKI